MDFPVRLKTKEIKRIVMKKINQRKAPGFDLITGKVLQETSGKSFKAITQIFNTIRRINHLSNQWKFLQFVMIPKLGKPSEDVKSYRPISLFSTLIIVL